MLALESARRGLRPLLVERDDFGQHTSGSWLRILHGGLRYLQTLDLPRHIESVRERRWFLKNFPDLVEPLRCVMPLYGRGFRRRWILGGALAANDVLSWYGNRGVRHDRRLPMGRTLSTEEVLRRGPSVRTDGLAGGAEWYDAVARRPQRLLMEITRGAAAEGATVVNNVEVLGLQGVRGRVSGVRAVDRRSDEEFRFQAPVVVNAAGPWAEELAETLDGSKSRLFTPSIACNLLLDRTPDFEGALAVEAPHPGARTYFVYPAHGGILAGTFHGPTSGEQATTPSSEMLDTFRRELDDSMPVLKLGSAPIRHVFSGRLPVRLEQTVHLSRRPVIHHHADHGGMNGAVSVSGVKFTTARAVALRVLSDLKRRGQLSPGPISRRPRPEPVTVPDAHTLETAGPQEIRDLVRHFVSREAARSMDDVLLRRTDWIFDSGRSSYLRQEVRDAVAGRLLGSDDEAP
jgi:glycerol-3-phosphate dehydrogenase